MKPSVAIILVNYNGLGDTLGCVESLRQIDYDNYKVFIVDNASTEAPGLRDKEELLRDACIIFSDINLGFSGGNNLAIHRAMDENFDYILLLNNDTIVTPCFLCEMLATAQSERNIGVVSGRIYYYYQRDHIWAAGGEYSNTTGLTIQYSGPDSPDFDKKRTVTFTSGCLMLISRKIIEKVGLLDETYFLYSEDTDYCQRIIAAGYKIVYCPTAKIYHKVSASTGHHGFLQQRYMMRNNLYIIQRYGINKPKAYFLISLQMAKHIIRKRRNLLPTIKGYIDFGLGRQGKIQRYCKRGYRI